MPANWTTVNASRLGIWCKLAVAALAGVSGCAACTEVYANVSVGPNFRVKVEDRGRAVAGLRLEMPGRTAITDVNGLATFRHVRPGVYLLRAVSEPSETLSLQVEADQPSNITVPLNWPAGQVVTARFAKGTFYFPEDFRRPADAQISVDLVEGVRGKQIGAVQSSNGEFNFGDVKPGLYLLRLSAGTIPIELDPNAPSNSLAIELGVTSCGLIYTDRNKCAARDLSVQQLCGTVVDGAEADIENADILVFDTAEAPRMVQRSRSGRAGKFDLGGLPAGTYQLVIGSAGFTSLRTRVSVDSGNAAACVQPMRVTLGILGTCSLARGL